MTKEEFTIQKLVEMRNELDVRIQNYKDGYFYICNVRSYGRNWKENYIHNTYTLQELCYQYNGDDGIVDVFSNNPNLGEVDNYGDVMYVPTVGDYEQWLSYRRLVRTIPECEEAWRVWDNRDSVPFKQRPYFAPYYTKEDIQEMKLELENFDMSFVEPVRVKYTEPVEEEQ
jgi:hypothetical protein